MIYKEYIYRFGHSDEIYFSDLVFIQFLVHSSQTPRNFWMSAKRVSSYVNETFEQGGSWLPTGASHVVRGWELPAPPLDFLSLGDRDHLRMPP